MEDRYEMTCLFDIYGELLTEKQRLVLEMFFDEDYSLTEIAQNEGVSRQAAFDLIRRSEKILIEYDLKLKLYYKYKYNRLLVDKLRDINKNDPQTIKLLDELEINL